MDSYRIIKFSAQKVTDNYNVMLESRFLRSLRNGNEYFKLIDNPAYFTVYRAYFRTLMQRPSSVIRLAVLSDDSDVVLGWSLTEPGKLHYVHVNHIEDGRDNLRRQGIGSALVPDPFDVFTHITKYGLMIWSKKFPGAKFNPFA